MIAENAAEDLFIQRVSEHLFWKNMFSSKKITFSSPNNLLSWAEQEKL